MNHIIREEQKLSVL